MAASIVAYFSMYAFRKPINATESVSREARGRTLVALVVAAEAALLAFLRRYGVGLVPLIAVFLFLAAYRDFRDNCGVEIFGALG